MCDQCQDNGCLSTFGFIHSVRKDFKSNTPVETSTAGTPPRTPVVVTKPSLYLSPSAATSSSKGFFNTQEKHIKFSIDMFQCSDEMKISADEAKAAREKVISNAECLLGYLIEIQNVSITPGFYLVTGFRKSLVMGSTEFCVVLACKADTKSQSQSETPIDGSTLSTRRNAVQYSEMWVRLKRDERKTAGFSFILLRKSVADEDRFLISPKI